MRPRRIVPEVVQSSAADCGPACIKALLAGFGVSLDYAKLRAACATDVDGTSINRVEDILLELGADVEQTIVPRDFFVRPEARALRSIVVTSPDEQNLHFVVAWRRDLGRVQVMDPAHGRRWLTEARLLEAAFVHTHRVPRATFVHWCTADTFVDPLRAALVELGVARRAALRLVQTARADPTGHAVVALDAAARFTRFLHASGASVPHGRTALDLVGRLAAESAPHFGADAPLVPQRFWSAWPHDEDHVALTGVVLVRTITPPRAADHPLMLSMAASSRREAVFTRLSAFALAGSGLTAVAIVVAIVLASVGVVLEAIIFRSFLDVGHDLGSGTHRVLAVVAAAALSLALLGLQLPVLGAVLRIGRRLESRFRVAVLRALAVLEPRYYATRLSADIGERVHAVHALRQLPDVAAFFVSRLATLVVTAGALAVFAPESRGIVLAIVFVAVVIPLAFVPLLTERELRVRTLGGALGRAYAEVLRGSAALRAHDARGKIEAEHDGLLGAWARAGRALVGAAAVLQAVVGTVAMGLSAWLVHGWLLEPRDLGDLLLRTYWAISLPMLAEQLVGAARQFPFYRGIACRAMEPIDALESVERPRRTPTLRMHANHRGVAVSIDQASIDVGGHRVLDAISLEVRSGEHVAIVGTSGAGKSTLLALLLGFHEPSTGTLTFDHEHVTANRRERLRQQTAWVDPDVGIFEGSLLDNLRYGQPDVTPAEVARVVDAAMLRATVARLPNGLQMVSVGTLSTGEIQRVRLGRAMLRRHSRLVLLDEALRGLDRAERRALLERAREWWRESTMFCAMHDVEAALGFDRVVVVEGGRIVEDANPRALASDPESRFARLLAADRARHVSGWGTLAWRRLMMRDGRLEAP